MKSRLLVLALVAGGTLFGQISIGIRIGPPPPERIVRVQPRSPGVGYLWVQGYWYPVAGHYRWHDGYWSRPPYEGAYWVAPRYEGQLYQPGRWEGNRGRVEHDHHWDHDRGRRDDGRYGEKHDGEHDNGRR